MTGLGSAGYLSTVSFSNLVSTPFLDTTLQSTVTGLGSAGYLSTVSFSNVVSTPFLDTTLQSTVTGLGSSGYLSTPITRSAFDDTSLTIVSTGAIQYRFYDVTATAQIRGNSATPTVAFSGYAAIYGESSIMYVNTGTLLSVDWIDVEATGMSNIGDTNIFTLQDITNSKMYRCTFAVGGSNGASATIYIETLI